MTTSADLLAAWVELAKRVQAESPFLLTANMAMDFHQAINETEQFLRSAKGTGDG